MIWFDVDTALSEVPINLMPLLDDTDFKSKEESVAYNAAGLDLVWNFVTTGGAFTQTAVTPTDTGGDYDWVNQGNGHYTIEIPATGGASINNDTEGFGWFTGVATGILPWRSPKFGFRDSGLNDKLVDSAYSATRGLSGTALPDAAADAAGGLPISDAGELDLDTQIGTDIDAILVDTSTTLDDKIDTVDTVVDNIYADMADASLLATAANLAIVDGIVDDILVDTGTTIPDLLDAIKGAGWSDETLVALMTAVEAGSIDEATVRSAIGLASANLDTQLSTIDGVVDDILEDTGTTIPNLLDSIVLTEVAAADVWGYSTRTLTNQGTSVESPATGDPLEIYRDTTVVISLTSLGDVSDYTNIWFTAKEDPENEADSVAVIQIDMTTGLLYIDGVAPTAAAEGSIVFSSETAGDCTITIAEEAAADLPIFEAYPINWDIKMLKSGVVSILSYGEMYIYATPTRTIV